MDAHDDRLDRKEGEGDRGVTAAFKTAKDSGMDALKDAASRLGSLQRDNLGTHLYEEADRGNEQEDEDTDPDRRNAS